MKGKILFSGLAAIICSAASFACASTANIHPEQYTALTLQSTAPAAVSSDDMVLSTLNLDVSTATKTTLPPLVSIQPAAKAIDTPVEALDVRVPVEATSAAFTETLEIPFETSTEITIETACEDNSAEFIEKNAELTEQVKMLQARLDAVQQQNTELSAQLRSYTTHSLLSEVSPDRCFGKIRLNGEVAELCEYSGQIRAY